jgi:hypothetical protein
MSRILAALAAVLLVLLTPAAAQAASTSRKDGDDTITTLDLKKVTLKTTGKKMTVTFSTYDAFADVDLFGLTGLGVEFEVAKGKVRGIAVKSHETGGLLADICTYRTTGNPLGTHCSPVKVTRLSDTSLLVTVARAKIDRGARSYRWRAGSFNQSTSSADCAGFNPQCYDTVPDSNEFLTWKP